MPLTARVLFAAAGTVLLLLTLGFGFTRTSSSTFGIGSFRTACDRYPVLPYPPADKVGAHDSIQHDSNETAELIDLLQHASNATLGVMISVAMRADDYLPNTFAVPKDLCNQPTFAL